jgi:hypothetical protein
MAVRVAVVWVVTSWVVWAGGCSFRSGGLGSIEEGEEGEDGATSIGSPPGAAAGSGGGAGAGRDGGTGGAAGVQAFDAGAPSLPDVAAPLPEVAPPAPMPAPPPDAAGDPPPAPEPAPPPDAAPPADRGIACGAATCALGAQVCCAGLGGASCIEREGACPLGAVRACDDPDDCQGDRVCCVRARLIGGFHSQCAKPGECEKLGGAAACRSDADCRRSLQGCVPTSAAGTVVHTCQR